MINDIKTRYDHIFVDEGQDMSYIQFLILKYFSHNSSLTIVGDLNQQIYLQNGIGDWEELRSLYNFKFITLDYNYRSTKEVMDLATSCLINPKYSGEGVLETGVKPMQYVLSPKESELTNWGNIIIEFLAVWQAKNESIAIITNSICESEQIERNLNNLGILNTNVIRSSDSILKNDEFNIISTLQVKGLEFNHVLIFNPSKIEFPYNDYSSKLLYMAMTRALFNLVLVVTDPPTVLKDHRIS